PQRPEAEVLHRERGCSRLPAACVLSQRPPVLPELPLQVLRQPRSIGSTLPSGPAPGPAFFDDGTIPMPRKEHDMTPYAFARLCIPALCLALLAAPAAAQAPVQPRLVPQPASLQLREGGFRVDAATPVRAEGAIAGEAAAQFAAMLAGTGLAPRVAPGEAGGAISFVLDTASWWPSPDAYALDVDADGVRVRAGDGKGLFYGAATLAQLLTSGDAAADAVGRPALHIGDARRFQWRGLMLDSGRHFQSVEEIQRLLDAMARLKLDVFHWHLTDDQGW